MSGARFERKPSIHESSPEGALVHRKPSRRAADARRDRRRRRRLALPSGAGVRRRDRAFGDALCACPPSDQGGARACGRRARYSQPGAGCGLRLPRSIHPRVPRPFRRHARSGPRTQRASTNSSCRSRSSWIPPHSIISSRRVSKPARPCWSPASANASITRTTAPAFPASGSSSTRTSRVFPDRVGKVAYGVCCNGDDSGNFDYIAGVEVSDFSDLPRDFSRVRIPEQKYAVFTHTEHISTIRRTVNTIWNHWLPASGLQGRGRAELRAL